MPGEGTSQDCDNLVLLQANSTTSRICHFAAAGAFARAELDDEYTYMELPDGFEVSCQVLQCD